MTLQIGRITGLPEPYDWVNDGDQVRLRGTYSAGSVNAGLIFREQILGYAGNPDEPNIPIISSVVGQDSGFYGVNAVNIDSDPVAVLTGFFRYEMQLRRLGGYQSAQYEMFITGALMANDYSIAANTAIPFHAYSGVYEYTNSVGAASGLARPTADASSAVGVQLVTMQPGAVSTFSGLARASTIPANFYYAACEIRSSSPSDHAVVGRFESPLGTAWTLRNGLVSISSDGTNFNATWADSTNTYRSTASVVLKEGGTAFTTTGGLASGIRILRNAPEECIIRIPLANSSFPQIVAYVDLSIRRGSRIVRFYFNTSLGGLLNFGHASTLACTAITAGLVATSADGFGHKAVICTSKTRTDFASSGNFGRTTNPSSTWDVGLTCEILSTGNDGAQNQIYQYMAAQAERGQIVAR